METIGQRIRRIRIEQGRSQRELSGPGISYAYISRIEAGVREPSLKAVLKLAQKLNVTALYIMTGQDDACPVCQRSKKKAHAQDEIDIDEEMKKQPADRAPGTFGALLGAALVYGKSTGADIPGEMIERAKGLENPR